MQRLRRYLREAALMVGVVLAVRCYQTRDLAEGKLPVAELITLGGERISVAGHGPTLVHVFATWCGVCKLEESSVQRVSASSRVVAIASRSGPAAEVRAYMKQHGLTYPVVLDPQGELARKLGVHAFPSSFFVDDLGEIRAREVGYTTELGLRVRLWLAALGP